MRKVPQFSSVFAERPWAWGGGSVAVGVFNRFYGNRQMHDLQWNLKIGVRLIRPVGPVR